MNFRRLGYAVAAWIVAACLARCGVVPAQPDRPPAPLVAAIYVVDRGWHTDLAFPVDEFIGPLGVFQQTFPGVRYLEFGFGERAYLLSRHRGLGDMLSALFPGPAAVLVTALAVPPAEAFGAGNVVPLGVSKAGIGKITDFVWGTIARDNRGQPIRIADGPYPGSLFYASSGTYSGFYTCNTWTADALRIGGLPVSSGGVLFAGQVMDRAHRAATLSPIARN